MDINKINSWDWPDSEMVPDPDDIYYMKSAPTISRENIEFLAEKYNELVCHLEQQTEDKG